MNLVLISTSNVASGRSEALARMLASIAAVRDTKPKLRVKLFLLLQEFNPAASSPIDEAHLTFTQVITHADSLSLSRARNILLNAAYVKEIRDDSVVAFPDDDCWYPTGNLEKIVEKFSANQSLDLWFCEYSSKPIPLDHMLERKASVIDVVRRASSNTIIMRGRIVQRIGHFDESLGVGTARKGAEDTDFAVSAFKAARQSVFLDSPCIGHRDYNAKLRAKYYPSTLFVIARHCSGSWSLKFELFRKIVIGGILVASRKLSPNVYILALKDGLFEFMQSRRSFRNLD